MAGHGHGPPLVGDNLPFSIRSPRLLAIGFTLYLGSAMALPFFTLRKQLKRMYNVK